MLGDKALAVARLLAGHLSSFPVMLKILPPAPCCDAVVLLVVVGGELRPR
jgi:hypothetical protein